MRERRGGEHTVIDIHRLHKKKKKGGGEVRKNVQSSGSLRK